MLTKTGLAPWGLGNTHRTQEEKGSGDLEPGRRVHPANTEDCDHREEAVSLPAAGFSISRWDKKPEGQGCPPSSARGREQLAGQGGCVHRHLLFSFRPLVLFPTHEEIVSLLILSSH